MDVVAAAGADDLEKIQFAAQPLILFQADDQGDVLEESGGLADFVSERAFEVVIVKEIQLQCGYGNVRTLQLEALLYPGYGGLAHGWVSSVVSS